MDITTVDNVLVRRQENDNPAGAIWLVHGFGGSGAVFAEAFSSELAGRFSLFAPDFPGFGASPCRPGTASIEAATALLVALVDALSGGLPVFLVGHSLGGIIGTRAAKRLGPRMRAYVNFEGNLTAADIFVTRLCEGYDDAAAFKRLLVELTLSGIEADKTLLRWLPDLCTAHPEALLAWARECVSATGEEDAGREYRSLSCPTLYLWGEKSAPRRSLDFLEKHRLSNRGFADCGHLLMIEKRNECWGAVSDFFEAHAK